MRAGTIPTRLVTDFRGSIAALQYRRRKYADYVADLDKRIARYQEILADWDAGLDADKIAKRHKVGVKTVYKVAHLNGGKIRKLRSAHSSGGQGVRNNARRKEMVRLYQCGMSIPQIAIAAECSKQRIQQILASEGVKTNRQRMYTDEMTKP